MTLAISKIVDFEPYPRKKPLGRAILIIALTFSIVKPEPSQANDSTLRETQNLRQNKSLLTVKQLPNQKSLLTKSPYNNSQTVLKTATNPQGANRKIQSTSNPRTQGARFRLIPELGFTTFNYSESGNTNTPYSSILMTAALAAKYMIIPRKLSLNASVKYNTFGLFTNIPAIGASLLWLNAGLEYTFTVSSWLMGIKAGGYYGSMSVTNNSFGFAGLYRITASPFVQKTLAPSMALGASFTYGPVLGSNSISNATIGAGLYWLKTFSNGETLKIAADYSSTNFNLLNTALSLNMIGLTLSYTQISLGF